MKLKTFTGILLAVAMTAGLWLWLHRPVRLVEKPVSVVTKQVATNVVVPLAKPVPANAPKMKLIAGNSTVVPAEAYSPAASDWSAVHKIVDTGAKYAERTDAISSLSTHLTDADWAVLQPFLLKPDPFDRTQLGQVVKNRLLDVLCSLNPPPQGLGDVLIKIYQDQQQDGVIRDYAVQHLAAYYEQVSLLKDSSKEAQKTQDVLWQATQESGDTIGGTALLALNRLSQTYSEFDRGKIATTALKLAGESGSGELTRITAYQVCAQLGTADALPLVLQAAQNGATIPVKISAIGALGSLGGPEQLEFLNGVLAGTEGRLKPAAQHALEAIAIRHQLASQK